MVNVGPLSNTTLFSRSRSEKMQACTGGSLNVVIQSMDEFDLSLTVSLAGIIWDLLP